MNQNNIVQLRRKFPDTHFFIYRGKRFPFNYNFLKISSNYFAHNEIEFHKSKDIQLLDREHEESFDIDDDTINNFIQYIHQTPIQLHDQNVAILNFLGQKYEIKELIECTKEYITSNQSDKIVDFLIIQQNDLKYDVKTYEEIISDHFFKYINEENILKLKISTVYRLLKSFKNKHEINKEQNESLFNLLIKYLDKYGKEASILFSEVDFEKLGPNCINLLVSKYSKSFDFHFINSNVFKTCYEYENEIIQRMKEKEIEQEKINQQLMNQISVLQKENDDRVNEIKQIKELNQNLADELKKLKEQFDEQIGKITKEMDEQKQLIVKLNKNINEINNLRSFEYNGNAFNGIICKLTEEAGGNLDDKGIVKATASSIHFQPKDSLDLQDANSYYHSKDLADSWLQFDFMTRKVKPTHYSIRSRIYGKGYNMKSWVIEGSNNRESWTELDSRQNETCLDNSSAFHTFDIKSSKTFFRYLRIRQTGPDTHGTNYMLISALEFFGLLCE